MLRVKLSGDAANTSRGIGMMRMVAHVCEDAGTGVSVFIATVSTSA